MTKRLTVHMDQKPIYDIVYKNSFADLAGELEMLNISNKKICIITDSIVRELYANEVADALRDKCKEVFIFSFQAGEESKNLDTVKQIYEYLICHKFDRKDILLALGGGVVGDITGYAAATYLRGIDFIQVPTTLLAQVDSSVGGKTGVDFDQYKNMVGAFKMPRLVYMNISVLNSLDDRQFFAGMAEVIKYGMIKSRTFYEWLIEKKEHIVLRDIDVLQEMVMESCNFKRIVVENDPTEKGERALLNFGHTIGHAVEKAKNFEKVHGECVALGSVASAYISFKRGYITNDEYLNFKATLQAFHLPVTVDHISPEEIVRLTASDKKVEGNSIKFILMKEIGNAIIDTSVTKDEMMSAVNEIIM